MQTKHIVKLDPRIKDTIMVLTTGSAANTFYRKKSRSKLYWSIKKETKHLTFGFIFKPTVHNLPDFIYYQPQRKNFSIIIVF